MLRDRYLVSPLGTTVWYHLFGTGEAQFKRRPLRDSRPCGLYLRRAVYLLIKVGDSNLSKGVSCSQATWPIALRMATDLMWDTLLLLVQSQAARARPLWLLYTREMLCRLDIPRSVGRYCRVPGRWCSPKRTENSLRHFESSTRGFSKFSPITLSLLYTCGTLAMSVAPRSLCGAAGLLRVYVRSVAFARRSSGEGESIPYAASAQ